MKVYGKNEQVVACSRMIRAIEANISSLKKGLANSSDKNFLKTWKQIDRKSKSIEKLSYFITWTMCSHRFSLEECTKMRDSLYCEKCNSVVTIRCINVHRDVLREVCIA